MYGISGATRGGPGAARARAPSRRRRARKRAPGSPVTAFGALIRTAHASALPARMRVPGAFQFAVLARLAARASASTSSRARRPARSAAPPYVAGLRPRGPDMCALDGATPIVSARYLRTERSLFGMSAHPPRRAADLPERLPEDRDELLVATTHAELLVAAARRRARSFASGEDEARRDRWWCTRTASAATCTTCIVASCYIPVVYARVPRLDGEVHVDGGAADNTLDRRARRARRDRHHGGDAVPRGRGRAHHVRARRAPPTCRRTCACACSTPSGRFGRSASTSHPAPLEEALTMPHREIYV